MNMILSFCMAALLCVGLYQLAGAILCFPTGRWLKSIQSYRGTPTLSQRLNRALSPCVPLVQAIWPMSEYRKRRLTVCLDRLGKQEDPERYRALALLRSILLALCGTFFLPFGFPLFSILLAIYAVLQYFKTIQAPQKKVAAMDDEIESELPRLIESINYSLADQRDLISIFRRYRRVAGPALGAELDILLMDMQTGNHESALRKMDSRLNIPQLSVLVATLCGVYQGADQRTSLMILEQDVRTTQREKLRKKMERSPGRIRAASFLLTRLLIFLFMVPLVILILSNLQAAGI